MRRRQQTRFLGTGWPLVAVGVGIFLVGIFAGWNLGRRGERVRMPAVEHVNATGGGGTWSVGTYNVRNFFDGFDNPYTADETTKPKSAGELTALAAAIRELNVDVLVMEEVEAGGFLKTFVKTRLEGMGYDYVVDESTEDPRGIAIGVVSRLPVVRIVSHRLAALGERGGGRQDAGVTEGNRFARDLLRVDVEVGKGNVVSVYGVHLKSKLGEEKDADAWRLAEAKKAREIIREEMTQELQGKFLVMGDCNDEKESAVVKTLEEAGDLGDGIGLVDVLAGLPAGERVTFESGKFKEGIDFLWVSPQMAERVEGKGEIMRGGAFEKASDHRPVRVRLRAE